MYRVHYYTDRNGNSPVKDYLNDLASKNDKDSRIKANKILEHIAHLKELGHHLREPHAKYLGNDLWELRPIRNRILYTAWDGNRFVLLHIFQKDTQKTPRQEIERAKRNLADLRERGLDNYEE